ncbi:MAG TPA: hypothetical protein VHG51_20730 [Longimicrobiaceae bacterium]|nr:hypothetical protein [Longimicrobiaceae bacterium]
MRAALKLWLLVLLLAAAACKPPRSPREVSEARVTGEWTAHSVAAGAPLDTGNLAWSLALVEREAGKVDGRGSLRRGGEAAPFGIHGQRAEHEITLEWALPGETVKFHGSVVDARTIVGEVWMRGDTLPVSFTRE